MYPGSDFPYHGRTCTHYQRLDEQMSWPTRMEIVFSWILDKDKPASLIMWYMEQPDSEGHAFSPSSQQERDMVLKVDSFVCELQQQVSRYGLDDRVNIIIVSDHGMETVCLRDVIDLREFMTPNTYKIVGTSPVLQVIPSPGYEKAVWNQLSTAADAPNSHFNVYNNDNVPLRWKVNNERRLGPILAVADLPYAFQDLLKLAKWFERTRNIPGNIHQ